MSALSESLVFNSKQALFAAIEIHNKPIFPYRYQICSILLINAWELLLKGYIAKYRTEVKLISEDGTTKPFEECLAFVKSAIGNEFVLENENLERLYEFRCDYIHFYQDGIDPILYSLLAKGVQLYSRFLLKFFGVDLCDEAHLILLPVGFKPPLSPIDFLSNKSNLKDSSKEVQEFVRKVIVSTTTLAKLGIEEPILYTFSMSVENEKRVKNADIVAAITQEIGHEAIAVKNVLQGVRISNEDGAKVVKVEEESLFLTVYTQSSREVYLNAVKRFPGLKQNKQYRDIMNKAKADPHIFKIRYLDVLHHKGTGQGFYSEAIYDVLAEHYKTEEMDNMATQTEEATKIEKGEAEYPA